MVNKTAGAFERKSPRGFSNNNPATGSLGSVSVGLVSLVEVRILRAQKSLE